MAVSDVGGVMSRDSAVRSSSGTFNFARRIALTASGFALPPVARITWPTNQPSVFGFVCTCSTCFGFAAMISSTTFSMAPVSVTCFRPRSSTILRGRMPGLQHELEDFLGDAARDHVRGDEVDQLAQMRRRNRALEMSLPVLFSAAKKSPMIQFAASFASRPLATASKKSAEARSDDQNAGIIGRKRILLHEARALLVRQLRAASFSSFFDESIGQLQRQQIGVGEIAVIVRFFLRAHGARRAGFGVEQRVSCLIVPPSSRMSIWRRASCSMAWPMKRMEFTFLISQRVPSGSPGWRTETFTSARSDPSSILPSQVPR